MIKWYKKLTKKGQSDFEAFIAIIVFLGLCMLIPVFPIIGIILTAIWLYAWTIGYKGKSSHLNSNDRDMGD